MKRTAVLAGITAILLAAGIAGSLYVLNHRQPQKMAEIYQNDRLLHRIDLSEVKEAYTITVDGENGMQNVIQIEPDAVFMKSATCPDGLCVHQGSISNGILPIICLPNHIRISIVSGAEEESIDAEVC
ncbi:MAG: NusG domain II-containing protein [Ruminococcus sp.]|nr:NusG domain II-containing protein [Ruminococcus sp.]